MAQRMTRPRRTGADDAPQWVAADLDGWRGLVAAHPEWRACLDCSAPLAADQLVRCAICADLAWAAYWAAEAERQPAAVAVVAAAGAEADDEGAPCERCGNWLDRGGDCPYCDRFE